jgi:hypothetical protein
MRGVWILLLASAKVDIVDRYHYISGDWKPYSLVVLLKSLSIASLRLLTRFNQTLL